ncbi:microcephalin [Aethina tumida]|uniref:microcephalin n=1 Tax=Aethina tumida TaxID=116153 RepID=UPI0021495A6B|nr:microcephalin [Aethina tumida]
MEFNEELYYKLMSDPVKRNLVIQMLQDQRGAIEDYKRKETVKKNVASSSSPFSKLQKKYKCESPTALMRRRALEKQTRDNDSDSASERSNSRQSTSGSSSPNLMPIPFDKLLEGVTAYVEIRSKDEDRSGGAKALMKSMGAKVRDIFSKDVTHVIFKDGCFTTYQKAKLTKVHLVSVLWLEAVRKNNSRVPERDYPALGAAGFDNDVSSICSQLQKDYEDVIREEVHRSIACGSPLPTSRTVIDKRRSLMSPSISRLSEYRKSPILPRSTFDKEIERINRRKTMHSTSFTPPSAILENPSSIVTSDDDSEIAIINGEKAEKSNINIEMDSVIEASIVEENSANLLSYFKSKKAVEPSDMELTNLSEHSLKTRECLKELNTMQNNSDMELTSIQSPSLRRKTISLKENIPNEKGKRNANARKTINSSDISTNISDKSTNVSGGSSRRKTINSSDRSTNISDKLIDVSVGSNRRKTINSSDKSTNISDESLLKTINVKQSDKLQIISKNCSPKRVPNIKKNMSGTTISNKSLSNNSSINIGTSTSKNTSVGTTTTNMSSLNVSFDKEIINLSTLSKNKDISSSTTTMSSLNITSDKSTNEASISSKKKDKSAGTTSSSMSPLIISTEKSPNKSVASSKTDSLELKGATESLNMSSLKLSTDLTNQEADLNKKTNNRRMSKRINNDSSMSTMPSLRISEDMVTTRKKGSNVSSSASRKSDLAIEDDQDISTNSSEINYRRSSRRLTRKSTYLEEDVTKQSDLDSSKTSCCSVGLTVALEFLDDKITQRRKGTTISHVNNTEEIPSAKNKTGNLHKARQEESCEESDTSLESSSSSDSEVDGKNTTKPQKTNKIEEVSSNVSLNERRKSKRLTIANEKHNFTSTEDSDVTPIKSNNGKTNKNNTSRTKDASSKTSEMLNNSKVTSPTNSDRKTKRKPKDDETPTPNKVTKLDSKIQDTSSENGKSSTGSSNKKRRIRKLYNPDESYSEHLATSDEKERNDKRVHSKRGKKQDVGVNLFNVLVNKPAGSEVNSSIEEEHLINELANLNENENTKKKKSNKKTQSKKEKESKKSQRDSEADEQKQLALEFVAPKTPKKAEKERHNKSVCERSVSAPITPLPNRRSTLDFQSISQSSIKRLKIATTKQPTIVCTKMHKHEVVSFLKIVNKLGRFKVEDEVTKNTTHLVAGEPKRTVNMLKAIVRGCWVLKKDWLTESLKADKWLSEEDFEETNFSPLVQKCRLQRQAFGPTFSLDIFKECGSIFIGKSTNPKSSDLKELVELCQGKVVSSPHMANIVVGEQRDRGNAVCVSELWVLDCITTNKIHSTSKYLIRSVSPEL